MEKGAQQPIIIKKNKGHGHGHHGGSWKVALADFMTAMMAFFMLMWLLGSTSKEEQKAIASYFQDPASEYAIGEGGANPGIINMDQPQAESHSNEPDNQMKSDHDNTMDNTQPKSSDTEDEKAKKELEKIEKEKLEDLKVQVQQLIEQDPMFAQIKDQILIDLTALGLRIQIVDRDQRPSFDVGSAHMKPWTADVLKALAPFLDKVQNKISVTGHTDSTPYGAGATYTNWELSADRANAARRGLLDGGLPENKIVTVQGMGSAAPLVADKPDAPINRRIAIIVLKKAVSDALTIGNSGINSDMLNSGAVQAPHIMTQKEVDAATDSSQ